MKTKGRPVLPATLKALSLYEQGKSGYEAVRAAGIALSTLYRHPTYKSLRKARLNQNKEI